jgi:NTP pyrophosphatase (non-canonical NTP hydrolase)
MHLREIQEQCATDSYVFFPGTAHEDLYLVTALAGEVGELANFIKKEHRGTPEPRKKLISELPDILIYLCMLAEHYNVDLEILYQEKRKYNVSRFAGTK